MSIDRQLWPLFEVFVRARAGLEHKHVGSVHAVDAKMALEHARDVYTRRMEGVSLWVVRPRNLGDQRALGPWRHGPRAR